MKSPARTNEVLSLGEFLRAAKALGYADDAPVIDVLVRLGRRETAAMRHVSTIHIPISLRPRKTMKHRLAAEQSAPPDPAKAVAGCTAALGLPADAPRETVQAALAAAFDALGSGDVAARSQLSARELGLLRNPPAPSGMRQLPACDPADFLRLRNARDAAKSGGKW